MVLIAVWAIIGAVLLVAALGAIGALAYPEVIDNTEEGLIAALFGLSIGTLLLALGLGVAVGAAIGLIRGTSWGRILGMVFAALNLVWFPIGTALGVLSIVYLTKPEVRDYFEAAPSEAAPA